MKVIIAQGTPSNLYPLRAKTVITSEKSMESNITLLQSKTSDTEAHTSIQKFQIAVSAIKDFNHNCISFKANKTLPNFCNINKKAIALEQLKNKEQAICPRY